MKNVLAFCFLTISSFTLAQLEIGDIAIVGFNSDITPDEMALVTLADISEGEIITITDYPWDGSSFLTTSTSNGKLIWTLNSSIPAGTLLTLTITSPGLIGGNFSEYGTIATTGWTGIQAAVPVASGGDSWLIYQSNPQTSTPNNWVFGFANWSTSSGTLPGQWRSSGTVTTTTSYLPDELTLELNAVGLTTESFHSDNLVYAGTRTGDKTTLLTEICDRSNWNGDEIEIQDLSIGGSNFPGAQPLFDITETLSITSNNSSNEEIIIYPIPTLSEINIAFREYSSYSIKIFNELGQLVNNKTTNVATKLCTLELDGPSGLYLIEISNAEGDKIFKKVLKE